MTRLPNQTEEVNRFLDDLNHPRKEVIEEVRAAIVGSNDRITEHIKWNAPSFCIGSEDRVTFRLRPGDTVQLIFHRGAKKRSTGDFAFDDPTGLLVWAAPDRAVLTLGDLDDAQAKREVIVELVRAWVAAVDGADG